MKVDTQKLKKDLQEAKDRFDDKSKFVGYGEGFDEVDRALYQQRDAMMEEISKKHGVNAWDYLHLID